MGARGSQEMQEAERSLRSCVKLNTFNPVLVSQQQVEEYLRSHASGTAHPLGGKLLVWDDTNGTCQGK